MTITVHALKRAIEEVGREAGNNAEGLALATIMHSPRVLTMLAERLSVRPMIRPAVTSDDIVRNFECDFPNKALRDAMTRQTRKD